MALRRVAGAGGGDEGFLRRWGRRALTIPAVLLLALGGTAVAPLAFPLTLLVDLAGRRRLGLTRGLAMFLVFLWCETLGLGAALVLWLLLGWRRAPFLAANARLQALWGQALFSAGQRILGMRVEIEGAAPPTGHRPLLVLVRHASTIDTLLPVVLLSYPLGWQLRYVLKRELLVDPCLDVVGNRLPNRFVRRGAHRTGAEVAAVLGLHDDLTPADAVVLFPEGTRFTPARRQRLLDKLASRAAAGDSTAAEELALSRDLQASLSPLRAGTLALLEHNPGADLLVVAHAGFEVATTMATFTRGATVGKTARIRLLHVPFPALPRDPAAQARLLATLWREVDRFALGPSAAASATSDLADLGDRADRGASGARP